MKKEYSLTNNLGVLTDHVSTIVESCDVDSYRDYWKNYLNQIFTFASEFCQNPTKYFPEFDKDQLELFFNTYMSVC